MKELSIAETRQVSGGLFTLVTGPVGGLLGFAIGATVDAGVSAVNGQKLSFKTSGALLGAGIGAIVGLSPILATTGIGLGVVSIVNNAKKFLGV